MLPNANVSLLCFFSSIKIIQLPIMPKNKTMDNKPMGSHDWTYSYIHTANKLYFIIYPCTIPINLMIISVIVFLLLFSYIMFIIPCQYLLLSPPSSCVSSHFPPRTSLLHQNYKPHQFPTFFFFQIIQFFFLIYFKYICQQKIVSTNTLIFFPTKNTKISTTITKYIQIFLFLSLFLSLSSPYAEQLLNWNRTKKKRDSF